LVLYVCVSCAASGNAKTCVLNDLEFVCVCL